MTSHTSTADPTTLAKLADLAREAVRTQARLARHTVDLGRATVTGDVDPATASRSYLEKVSSEGERYWRLLGELGADYASDLKSLGGRLTSTILMATGAGRPPNARQHAAATPDHVMPEGGGPVGPDDGDTTGTDDVPRPFTDSSKRRKESRTQSTEPAEPADPDAVPRPFTDSSKKPGQPRGTTTTPAGPDDVPRKPFTDSSLEKAPRRLEVTLEGPPGGAAVGTFTVENQNTRARRIDVLAGPVTGRGGAELTADLQVEPRRVTVPAGQDRVVTVSLDLASEEFKTRRSCHSTIEVSGGDEATVDVTIKVVGT